MDGSIADATSLRMRHQLQRAYQPNAQQSDPSFFDELLKLPVAQSTVEVNPDTEFDDPAESADQPRLTNESQAEKTPAPEDDDGAEDEPQLDNQDGLMMACCAAQSLPLPQADPTPPAVEPSAPELDSSVPSASATPDQPIIAARDAAQKIPVKIEAAAAGQVQPPTAITGLQDSSAPAPSLSISTEKPVLYHADQPGEPIEKIPAPLPAAAALPKSSPRPKSEPARSTPSSLEKPTTSPQPQAAQAAVVEPVVHDRDQLDRQPTIDNEPNLSQAAAPPVAKDERSERSAKSSERDKWYQADTNDSRVDPAEAAAEQREQADQQSHSGDEARMLESPLSPVAENAAPPEFPALADLAQQAAASATSLMPVTVASTAESVTPSAASKTISGGIAVQSATPSATTSAGTSSTARSSAGNGTDASRSDSDVRQLSQQERVRLVQRVARSFSRLGPEGGQVTLKLHPPQLGVLNVSIRIEGQSMSAKLQTESSAARDVILENLPVLRERLAEQGIEVETFQVEVGNTNDNANGGQLSNSSGGDLGAESRSGGSSTGVDYRRLSRQSVARPALDRAMPSGLGNSTTLERSLDIRA